ncbi:MAG: ABC transporter permease [Candidatus Altiarchaeota archaeon]|nr:ABC transporter permease [Candidatus Altiarchaeota archaeon]
MINPEAIYWIWYREVLRFWRTKSRLFSSIAQPLMLLAFLGGGLSFMKVGGASYQVFMFPGILCMSLLTVSVMSGISVIWDKEFGFLKEILVSPISRLSMFIGKALGGASSAMLSSILILTLAPLLGVKLSLIMILQSLVIMFLVAIGFVSLGLIIASFLDSFEGFGMIMNFLVMPLFFLSGALFPLEQVPAWLKTISMLDPVTYGVDALRTIILGESVFPMQMNLTVLISFAIVMFTIGTWTFNRQE